MSITFSIVIPAHNEEAFIAKVLHSIKQQTYQNYEIIIVTNGVNDKILHLNLNTANVSRARNYGAGKAQGKYLLFLDADTLLEPNTLKVMKESFKEHHAVAVTRVKAVRISVLELVCIKVVVVSFYVREQILMK